MEWKWKEEKVAQGPSLQLIGLKFCAYGDKVVCENTADRKRALAGELLAAAAAAPSESNLSSTVGKVAFASRGLCGRVGGHARRPLYWARKRIDSIRAAEVWPPHVKAALQVWAKTILHARPREVSFGWYADRKSAIIYGDAALSTRRMAAALFLMDSHGGCNDVWVFPWKCQRSFFASSDPTRSILSMVLSSIGSLKPWTFSAPCWRISW